MKIIFRLILIGFIPFVAACSDLPSVHDDIREAERLRIDTSPANRIALFREESEKVAGVRFVGGNEVELLRNGGQAYPAMLQAIRKAKKRIDMESYTFDDEAGKQFAAALKERRAAGVEINLIYDAWGSSDTSGQLFQDLKDHGINTLEYNPIDLASMLATTINQRDHRKLLIVDGNIVFVGGINISEVYKLRMKKTAIVHKENNAANEEIDPDTLPWRDTHVRIRGPVAAEFEKLFMLTWYQQKGDRLNDPPPTHIDASDGLLVQAIDGTPGENRYTIYRSLLTAITLARSSVHLTTAFFVPTPDLIHALEEAAERGADVVLVLPSESTSDFALKAGHAYYEDLMEAGVKIYERKGAILHAKTAVVDGIWSTVGSSNLDWRSVLFNNECNAVILGPAFGEKMESMFRDDVQQSQYIDPKTWSQRSMWQSLDEWKAKILEYFL